MFEQRVNLKVTCSNVDVQPKNTTTTTVTLYDIDVDQIAKEIPLTVLLRSRDDISKRKKRTPAAGE